MMSIHILKSDALGVRQTVFKFIFPVLCYPFLNFTINYSHHYDCRGSKQADAEDSQRGGYRPMHVNKTYVTRTVALRINCKQSNIVRSRRKVINRKRFRGILRSKDDSVLLDLLQRCDLMKDELRR